VDPLGVAGFTMTDGVNLFRPSFAMADGNVISLWDWYNDGTGTPTGVCWYDGSEPALLDDLGRAVPAWTAFPWEPGK
jgi:hypothetical protein